MGNAHTPAGALGGKTPYASGMSRTARVVILACAGLMLAGCRGAQRRQEAAARAEAEAPDGFRVLELGLCEDYPEETRTIDEAMRDLLLARDAGLTHLRVSIGWDGVEPADDQFDWAFWDGFIPLAVEEYGITLIPYVCYTPDWAADVVGGEDPAMTRPPRDMAEFEEFMREAAGRYAMWIDSWEIWNEPDNPAYWTGTEEEFGALVGAGARAVRAADPDAVVVLGGIAWDLSYLGALLDDAELVGAIDVVNLHNYFETWSPEPLEAITPYVLRAAELVRRYGDGERLWMAEVGYSTFRRGGYVSDQYVAAFPYEHTPEYQAVHLLRTLTLLAASGEIDLVAWYEIADLPSGEQVIGDVNNRHLGVVDVDRNPKPALAALALGQDLFAEQPVRCIDGEVLVERALDSDAEVHAFEREDGSVLVLAWLRTAGPDVDGRPTIGAGADERVERVSVEIPRRLLGATRLNPDGSGAGRHPRERRRGWTGVELTLTGGTIEILRLDAPRRR